MSGGDVQFFCGVPEPAHAQHFDRAFVSVARLRRRKSDFRARDWIMDSGAFSEVVRHGGYRHGVEEYAGQIRRWSRCGRLRRAVAQDFMCEPFVLAATGLSVGEHQRLTVERFRQLAAQDRAGVRLMPVLQGFQPEEYVGHVRQYGSDLPLGSWVGVGSVCKRNRSPLEVAEVLRAIKRVRPDLRLHGFGLKETALASGFVRDLLYSADSMAWSFAARRQGRNANDWREGAAFAERVARPAVQLCIGGLL